MKSSSKLNLTKFYTSGKFLSEGEVTWRRAYREAQAIPSLKKLFDVTDKQLREEFNERLSKDLIASLNDTEGKRLNWVKPGDPSAYISFEERYGTKEGQRSENFASALNKAFINSDDQPVEVKEMLLELVKIVNPG